MTKMTREEAIRTYVEQLSGSDLAELIQTINEYDGSFEDAAYFDMDEFDYFMTDYTPTGIVQMAWFGDFNPNEDYFKFDGYGNLVSLNENEIEAETMDFRDDVIDHLTDCYTGDTPWEDLTTMVDADADAVFDEDFDEIYEDDDEDDE